MRELDRREFLKLAAITTVRVATIPLISVCGAPTETSPTATPTQSQAKDASKKSPDQTPVPTNEQVAKSIVLREWRRILTTQQKRQEPPSLQTIVTTQITMAIDNQTIWNDNIFGQVVKTGRQPDNIPALRARWFATQIHDNATNGFAGAKWVGELQIMNIKIEALGSEPKKGSLEEANGYGWAGLVNIKFFSKSRSVTESTKNWVPSKNKDAFQNWITSQTSDTALPNFPTDWNNDGWGVILAKKNDIWQPEPNYVPFYGNTMLGGFSVPSIYLKENELPFLQCNCTKVVVDIK